MTRRGRKNLAQKAYEEIKGKILENRIKPGELISENILAEELGISRTPIREAIRMLESENIVESRDGVGTIIKMFSYKELKDMFEVRKSLEIIAAKTSIHKIPEEAIEELMEGYKKIDAKFKVGAMNEKEFTEIDLSVHSLIVSHCDNGYVREIFSSIILKIRLYQYAAYLNFESNQESIQHHLFILRLLKEKNLEKLISTLEAHLDWSLDWYLQALMRV